MTLLATTLPQNTGSGYVAAAYIVFFAIVLIYVTIMAIRLTRVERDLSNLRTRTEQEETTEQREAPGRTDAQAVEGARRSSPEGAPPSRERETV
jgi:hypothetical protein